MPLGSDALTCQTAFVEAMRARLNAQDPALANNVDRVDVKPNLQALGNAAYDILAHHAQAHSNAAADATFWNWVAALSTWAAAMFTWENGLNAAFAAWAPATAPDVALKSAVVALPHPGAPPVPPASLTGTIV